jgi:voltage-gated potassium channel
MVSGRAAAMVMMLFSMGVVAVFTARIASVFVATKLREDQGLQEIYDQGHLLVTGWHPGAERIVDPIVARARRQLTLVFVNNLPPSSAEEITTRYAGQRARYVRGDATQSAVLKRAGAADAWAAVVLPDHEEGIAPAQVDQQSVLTVLALRQITKSLPIVAYALTPQSVPHFRHSGAEQVVVRDSHAGFLLGSHLFSPGVPEVFQLLASHENAPSLDRMEIPEQFHGRPLKELEAWVRKRGGVLLGLAARQRTLSVSDILSDDTSGIDAFIRRKFAEAGRSPEELSRGRVRLSPDPEETVTGEEVAVVLHRNGKERP